MYFRSLRILLNALRRFADSPSHLLLIHHRRNSTLIQFTISTGLLCLSWPFSKFRESNFEEKTCTLLKTATIQIREKKYKEADENLHQILQILAIASRDNEINPEEHARSQARVFLELAKLNLCQQNYVDAEKLLTETIRFSIAAGMDPQDSCIVELSLKLALLYSRLGEMSKASSGLEFCFDVQMKKTGAIFQSPEIRLSDAQQNEIALLGLVSNAYAHFLIKKGDFSAALEKLETSLKSAQLIYPPNHDNILHLQADLASTDSRLGNSDKALGRLKSVISNVENQSTPNLPLIRLFCAGALIEGNRGEFISASGWLDKAIEAASRMTCKPSQELAQKEIQSVRNMLDAWQKEEEKAAGSEIEN
nr:tetratricopeptide repeat protein 19 [Hymenolepis microstoma]CDS35249.2 expressed protein [Hymenolepis microstoma]CUU99538.1 tetratricopeptide repeat protein 19 [Hymenolepis microstoma]